LPNLAPSNFPLFSWLKIPLFWHTWGDRGRIAGGAKHPHRTQLPKCIQKVAEALGTGYLNQRGM
jgi:hypothetical protein